MSSQVLHPGEYFIELEFDRLVEPAVLHRALTSMGFGVVVFDQSLPTVEVGALSLAATSMVRSSLAKAIAAPVAAKAVAAKAFVPVATELAARPAITQALLAAARPAASPTAYATAKPTVVPIQSRYGVTNPRPSSQVRPAYADGGGVAALKPSATVTALADIAKRQGAAAVVVKPSSTLPAYGPGASATATPSTDKAAGPAFPGDVTPAAPATPDPKADFVAPPADGGGGGGGYVADPQPEEQAQEAAPPEAAAPEPLPEAPTPAPLQQEPSPTEPAAVAKKLLDLWSKWKEWGSPFATGPMTNTSGVGATATDDDPLRFRVLARLDRPIALDDRPGMRWLFVKALSVPFLSDLVFQSNPHPLRQGGLYELRFLSRAKSNPTRESVKQGLVDMGFQPVKLSAIKRNMKLPNRPASLTLWYGMAVWRHADSVIINDDPFFFETVKEMRTQ